MGANESASGDDIINQEAHHWYTKFMKECPSGQLSLHEFKALLDLHGMNSEANHYVDQVFNTFDLNKGCAVFGYLNSSILSRILSRHLRGRRAERIEKSLMKQLDSCQTLLGVHHDTYLEKFDNCHCVEDGFIDFLEFIAAINLVIRGKIDQKLKWYFKLYDADGNGTIDKKELVSIFTAVQSINGHQDMTPEEFTNMVFQKIDVNNDGELTLEEFINGVESDGNLLEMISKTFDLSNVLKVIQSGRRHSI